MARETSVVCDWCHEDLTLQDEDDSVEQGWILIMKYDNLREEIQELDFCSGDCVKSFFS